jgi:uncharacterized membrane-anchored protein YitT (DUF2179 family)
VYSVGLWALGDELVVPLLGLQSGPTASPPVAHVNRLAAHLLYGAGLSVGTQALHRVLDRPSGTGARTAVDGRTPNTMRLRRILPLARDYLMLTAGALCVALAVDVFLVPNHVVAGGVTGVAILLHTLLGTPVGLVVLLINAPLFWLGVRSLGGVTFGVRTVYATVVLALAIDAFAPIGRGLVVRDPLLYTFYGGLLDGLGLGLVFRGHGTTGGIDIVARLLERRWGWPLGQSILALDAFVFAAAGWIYGATPVLYALLVAFISSRVVNIVQEGVAYARSALIVTGKPEEVREAVLRDLSRGLTMLEGKGGYTSATRAVLLCVVARSEESVLTDLVASVDPAAFVVISDAVTVLGQGFKALDRR